MASNTETGRAKNIANFRKLQLKLAGFGATYSPANPDLKADHFLQLHADATELLQTFNTVDGQYKTAANDRQLAVAPVSKLISRSRRAIKSGIAPKEVKAALDKDAGTIANKYRGIRSTPVQAAADPTAPAPDPISVAHTSFVQRANTFSQLIALYTAAGATYAPSAADLKIASLNALHATMDQQNDIVETIITARENARIPLLKKLYNPNTGMVDLAYAAKNAVAEIYGPNSLEFKQIAKITFSREVM